MDYRISTPCEKIAAFDLDYTLLKPSSKHKFPQNKDDAIPVFANVGEKLLQLQKDGYKIVIFTNQAGIGKHTSLEDIYYKIDKYLPDGKKADVYISYKHDRYRKPLPTMFDQFIKDNGSITDIFYVGDAAGRKGDHSASDVQFAHNCEIPFYTPEQFFLGKEDHIPKVPLIDCPKHVSLKRSIPDGSVVVLVGPPGSGKSTLARSIAEHYPYTVIINNDTTGSEVKSIHLFKEALKKETPRIIIDNTNATILNRAVYTELAKDHQYKVYAITIDITREIAMHLNYWRAYTQGKDLVPVVAYSSYYKRLQPVQSTEAYNTVMNYVPKLPKNIFKYSF